MLIADLLSRALFLTGDIEGEVRVLKIINDHARGTESESTSGFADALSRRGSSLLALGKMAEAEVVIRETLAWTKLHQPGSDDLYELALKDLSRLQSRQANRGAEIATLQESLELYERRSDIERSAAIAGKLGSLLFLEAQSTKAKQLLEKYYQIARRDLGVQHKEFYWIAANLATIHLQAMDTRSALDALEPVSGALSGSSVHVKFARNTFARTLGWSGRVEEGVSMARATWAERKTDPTEDMRATIEFVQLLTEFGRFSDAQVTLEESILRIRLEDVDQELRLLFEQASAKNLLVLGQPERAERVFRAAVSSSGFDKAPVVLRVGMLQQLSLLLSASGQHKDGLKLLLNARSLAAEYLGASHLVTMELDQNLMVQYKRAGDHDGARAAAVRVLESARSLEPGSNEFLRGVIAGLVSDAAALIPDEPTMLAALRRHSDIFRRMNPGSLNSMSADYTLAAQLIGRGHVTEGRVVARRLVDEVEEVWRAGKLSPQLRSGFFESAVPIFHLAAVAEIAGGDAQRAFRALEMAKGRSLLESLASATADADTSLPIADRLALQQAQAALRTMQNATVGNAATMGLTMMEATVGRQTRRVAEIEARLKLQNPKYALLSEVQFAGAADAKHLLDDQTIFISFMVARQDAFGRHRQRDNLIGALTLTKGGDVQAWDIGPPVEGLRETLDAYRKLLESGSAEWLERNEGLFVWQQGDRFVLGDRNRPQGSKRILNYQDIGEWLTDRLLRPVKDLGKFRKWIIAPDGPLAALAFETLPFSGAPVVVNHDVSYTQSFSNYSMVRRRAQEYRSLSRSRDLIAVGGAQYERSADALRIPALPAEPGGGGTSARGYYEKRAYQWTELPGTKREVVRVAALFEPSKSQLLTDAAASESVVRKLDQARAFEQTRYVLFSTHGHFSAEEPALSALVLSQVNTGPEDGYLTAAELVGYHLKTDLVFLSACDTGRDNEKAGTSILGLPYALFVAGNVDVIQTLWAIPDESTALFVESFFRRVQQGEPISGALANVKREFARSTQYDHPRFWAPFVHYGQ